MAGPDREPEAGDGQKSKTQRGLDFVRSEEVQEGTKNYGAAVVAILGAAGNLLTELPELKREPKGDKTPVKEEPPNDAPTGEGDDEMEEPQSPEPASSAPVAEGRKYTNLGGIVSSQTYGNGVTTQEHLDRLVDLFEGVFHAKQDIAYYYSAKGETFPPVELPNNWFSDVPTGKTQKVKKTTGKGKKKKTIFVDEPIVIKGMTDKEKTSWHNEHRAALPIQEKYLPTNEKEVGYPLVATPVLPGVEPGKERRSLIEVIMERLNVEVEDPGQGTKEGPRHLEGEKMPYYDAILKMAEAYNIPRAIILGIGANESGYDQTAISKAKAYGVFQLQPGAYQDAKKYAESHPEFSGKVRKGDLVGFFDDFHGVIEWKNRLVQAEMACAYYRVIQATIQDDLHKLETRLMSLDPSYMMGTLSLIAPVTAYNAGPGLIQKTIRRFLHLNDEEMKKLIGKPPYGVDAWQAVLANSFGLKIKNKKGKEEPTKVGPHVFTYAAKVLAMGTLITEEQDILKLLAEQGREQYRSPAPMEPAEPVPELPSTEKPQAKSRAAFMVTALLSMLGGLIAGGQAKKALKEKPMDRRSFIQGLGAFMGLGVPAVRMGAGMLEHISKDDDNIEPVKEPREVPYETYPEVIEEGEKRLEELFVELKRNEQYTHLPSEADRLTNWKTSARVAKLKPLIREVFGNEWDDYLVPTVPELPGSFYDKETATQEAYMKKAIAAGELIPLEADNPNLPYFCQQIGHKDGIQNDPEVMYINKEFLPVLDALVVLVNHQIDAFNQDPKSFGMQDENYPKLPHITGIKLGGALRRLKFRLPASTESFSDHWLGTALDMASQGGSEGAMMVRFKEAFVDQGVERFPAGGKLPAQGEYGGTTRAIMQVMIERALFVLEDVLKAKPGYPQILPCYEESVAKNWHVGLVPSRVLQPELEQVKQVKTEEVSHVQITRAYEEMKDRVIRDGFSMPTPVAAEAIYEAAQKDSVELSSGAHYVVSKTSKEIKLVASAVPLLGELGDKFQEKAKGAKFVINKGLSHGANVAGSTHDKLHLTGRVVDIAEGIFMDKQGEQIKDSQRVKQLTAALKETLDEAQREGFILAVDETKGGAHFHIYFPKYIEESGDEL